MRQAALVSIANALVAQELALPESAVKATLHDREGELNVKVAAALPLQTIEACRNNPNQSIYHLTTAKRHTIAERFEHMSSHKVSKVDLTLTGVRMPEPERRVK